jgi:hypothetical protein
MLLLCSKEEGAFETEGQGMLLLCSKKEGDCCCRRRMGSHKIPLVGLDG